MSGTQKNVSDFVQKHFVSATNVSQFCAAWKQNIYFVSRAFARPRNIISDVSATMCPQQCVRNNVSATMCPQQCVRNNVSSFARALVGEMVT